MNRNLRLIHWLEFFLSAIFPIDWYYALEYKRTAVDLALFPNFCKRRHSRIILAMSEHLIYFLLALLIVKLLDVSYSILLGFAVIFIIVPIEFLLFRIFKRPLFVHLPSRSVAIAALWNMLNIGIYWLLGMIVGILV